MEPRSLALQADSLPLSHQGSSLVLVWATKCWPKTNRMPDAFPAKMRLFRISRNCKLRSRTMVNHMQVPAQQGKDFLEGKRKMGGLTVSKEPKTFHWLSPCWKEEEPFYLLGFATVAEMRAPSTGLQVVLIFTWGFCINFFTGPWARHWGSLHMKGAEIGLSMAIHLKEVTATVLINEPNFILDIPQIYHDQINQPLPFSPPLLSISALGLVRL